MIINLNNEIRKDNCCKFSNDNIDIYWKGLIFLPGIEEGNQTISRISELLDTENIRKIAGRLMGTYFLYIYMKRERIDYAMVDNSRMYNAYYSDRSVYTSFTDVLESNNFEFKNLNKESVYEYIRLGSVYGVDTLFSNLKRIDSDEILVLKINEINVGKKIFTHRTEYASDILRDIFLSIRKRKIDIDLTGGVDSRWLCTAASMSGLDFSVSTIGNENNKDVLIASQIAYEIGKQHTFIQHSSEGLDKQMEKLVKFSDVSVNILDNHRSFQIQNIRFKNGKNLAISGVGGELFKEILLQQEFPFVNSGMLDIRRILRMRIDSAKFDNGILSSQLKKQSVNFESRMIEKIRPFAYGKKMQAINNIWFSFKIPSRAGLGNTGSINDIIDIYSPLMERRMFDLSLKLRPEERILDRWLRTNISSLNRNVAAIRTDQNIRMLPEAGSILMDMGMYATSKYKKLVRKVLLKNRGVSKHLESPVHAGFYTSMRKSDDINHAITTLNEKEVINRGISVDNISNNLLGNLVSLAKILEII